MAKGSEAHGMRDFGSAVLTGVRDVQLSYLGCFYSSIENRHKGTCDLEKSGRQMPLLREVPRTFFA